MFSANVAALHQRVAEREIVLRSKRLDQRRLALVREIMRGVDNSFLTNLEEAIATAHMEWGYCTSLKSYPIEEVVAQRCDHTTLLEVFRETDLLVRLGNRLAPGHFKCVLERRRRRYHNSAETYEVMAHFSATGFEPTKVPCICILHDLTDGFCELCGGFSVRPIMNPEEVD